MKITKSVPLPPVGMTFWFALHSRHVVVGRLGAGYSRVRVAGWWDNSRWLRGRLHLPQGTCSPSDLDASRCQRAGRGGYEHALWFQPGGNPSRQSSHWTGEPSSGVCLLEPPAHDRLLLRVEAHCVRAVRVEVAEEGVLPAGEGEEGHGGGGTVSTAAGNGAWGRDGGGGPATSARIDPYGLAADSNGGLWMTDRVGVRYFGRDGTINRIAGGATTGFGGDDIASIATLYGFPYGIALAATDISLRWRQPLVHRAVSGEPAGA